MVRHIARIDDRNGGRCLIWARSLDVAWLLASVADPLRRGLAWAVATDVAQFTTYGKILAKRSSNA